jgi:hypothetical protein
MNTILLSFLCGSAFIGGGVATTCLVSLAVSLKDKKGRDELHGYWRKSISNHEIQLEVLERIASQLEKLVSPNDPSSSATGANANNEKETQ